MGGRTSFVDLSGRVFGRLTALYETPRREKTRGCYWLCYCSCGNFKEVAARGLVHGKTTSCGCWHKEAISKDLIGRRFGRLLVIERADRQGANGAWFWKCLCDCGNYKEVNTGNLQASITKSCGCLAKETARALLTKHGLYGDQRYRNAYSKCRKEKKRLLDSEWSPYMEILLRAFDPHCAICGMENQEHIDKYNESLHTDHVKPLSKGYGLSPGNAVLLCKFHNIAKLDKELSELPEDWQLKIEKANESFRLAISGGF